MKLVSRVKYFRDRYPFIGPTMWILCVEYFIAQVIVARAWSMPYSIRANTISDLGNSICGLFNGRYVCSPFHALMNSALICLGVFMLIGSSLIYHEFKPTKYAALGFGFMAIAGLGTVLVGVFPENSPAVLHTVGAAMPFLIGNVGIIILGAVLKLPVRLRWFSLATGIISLIGLAFFITNYYLGLGIGGMERIVAYPQTIWLIVFGLYISKNHYQLRKSKPLV